MSGNENIKPVFLLGTARSGTTMLGETLLSQHPGISYLGEINYLWKYGHEFNFYDDIDAESYPKKSVNIIKKQIIKQSLNKNPNASIFIDKTPANCLRVDLLTRVFPEAKFIHLSRCGEDVAKSALNEWLGQAGNALDSIEIRKKPLLSRLTHTIKRKSNLQRRVFDLKTFFSLFSYFPSLFRMLSRMLGINSKSYWGPKFQGIKEIVKNENLEGVCYKQWEVCESKAIASLKLLPIENILNVRYEEICSDPIKILEEIFLFLELPYTKEQISNMASRVKAK